MPARGVLIGPLGPIGRLHVAATPWSRLRGLILKAPLGPDEALLLDPCRRVHTFGVRFPIDAVFCDFAGRVVHVATLAPRKVSPYVRSARMCIELAAGRAAEASVEVGTRLAVETGR